MQTIKRVLEDDYNDINHIWVARDKDIVTNLLDSLGEEYIRFPRAGRGLLSNGVEILSNIARCIRVQRKHRIDLWFTKYGSGNIAAWLTNSSSIAFNDDDIDIVPLIALTSYPFSDSLIFPEAIRSGKYRPESVTYNSCQELVYLHPHRFTPNRDFITPHITGNHKGYCLLRLSALTSHHDWRAKGLSDETLYTIIELCTKHGKSPVITTERALPADLTQYIINLPLHRIHHYLAFADLYLGDSQSMALEAAVLGTPTIRISSFSNLSIIHNLESFGLIKSIAPDDKDEILRSVKRILSSESTKNNWQAARENYLNQADDPLPIFIETILSRINQIR